jgi:hypothetical protein
MSNQVREISTLKLISECFSKLVLLPHYHGVWRTNDQWAALLIHKYRNVLSPVLKQEEFHGRVLDAALRKDKVIKANLRYYTIGSNCTGIMCRDYKPRLEMNGTTKQRCTITCYILVQPFHGEPPLPIGKSWFQTLPPTQTRKAPGQNEYVKHHKMKVKIVTKKLLRSSTRMPINQSKWLFISQCK